MNVQSEPIAQQEVRTTHYVHQGRTQIGRRTQILQIAWAAQKVIIAWDGEMQPLLLNVMLDFIAPMDKVVLIHHLMTVGKRIIVKPEQQAQNRVHQERIRMRFSSPTVR